MAERLNPGFRRPCWHLFSTTFRYALISLVELAVEARTLQTRQIAARFELSPHYLAVVLRELRRLGLVESIKGNRGGYRLLRPAAEINLLELYRSLAGSDGNGLHGRATPGRSPADTWLQNLAERWGRDLEAVSLVDLCSEPGS
jgi:Rrf2 family iron-sulfur cluster assembly transcriptional regulator